MTEGGGYSVLAVAVDGADGVHDGQGGAEADGETVALHVAHTQHLAQLQPQHVARGVLWGNTPAGRIRHVHVPVARGVRTNSLHASERRGGEGGNVYDFVFHLIKDAVISALPLMV